LQISIRETSFAPDGKPRITDRYRGKICKSPLCFEDAQKLHPVDHSW
jgi:hypothetical protein